MPELRPTDSDWDAFRAFQTRYPVLGLDHVSLILQPAPLVFDPALKVCIDHQAIAYYSQQGLPPQGLVTRTGVESDRQGLETAKIYATARRAFDEMSEEGRSTYRRSYAAALFGAARVLIPIGPDTNLEQIKRMWPIVIRAQRACYGVSATKRAIRRNIYDDRIAAYDQVRRQGLTIAKAAARARVNPRTFLRRFSAALRDIEGITKELSPGAYKNHVATCSICRDAESRGTSDRYCRWMQRRLGPRSVKSRGVRVPLDVENLTGEANDDPGSNRDSIGRRSYRRHPRGTR